MNPTLLEDYIEILEADDNLDGRHKKLLEIAKEELEKFKDLDRRLDQNLLNGLDLDRVDHEFALAVGK